MNYLPDLSEPTIFKRSFYSGQFHSDSSRILYAGIAILLCMICSSAHAYPVHGQGTWETTMHARDINGDGEIDAYYDSSLNITWLLTTQFDASNRLWNDAVYWASQLNVYGITGWRLPHFLDTGATGCDWSYAGGTDCGENVDPGTSELAHLWYVTYGNKAACAPGSACGGAPNQTGWGDTNFFPGLDIKDYTWLDTAFGPSKYGTSVWYFNGYNGMQWYTPWFSHDGIQLDVAVRSGEVAFVPIPATLWLIISGLIGLGLTARKRGL